MPLTGEAQDNGRERAFLRAGFVSTPSQTDFENASVVLDGRGVTWGLVLAGERTSANFSQGFTMTIDRSDVPDGQSVSGILTQVGGTVTSRGDVKISLTAGAADKWMAGLQLGHAGNFESEGDVTVLLEGGKSAVPLDLYGMWVTDGDYASLAKTMKAGKTLDVALHGASQDAVGLYWASNRLYTAQKVVSKIGGAGRHAWGWFQNRGEVRTGNAVLELQDIQGSAYGMRLDGNARVGVDDAISVRIGSYAGKAAGLSMGGAASLTSNILNLRLEGGSSSYGADLSKNASLAVGDLEVRDCAYGLVLDGMAEAAVERYVADADAAVTAKGNSNVSIASGFTTLRESVLWEEGGARISVGADEKALVRFTGYARQDEEGDGIALRLGKEGSFWNVTRSSSLSELSVHDGAALRFFFTTDETRSFRGARGEGEDAFVVVQGENPVLLAPGTDIAIVVDSPLTLGEELRLVKSGAGFAVSEGSALGQLEADADLNDRMSRTDEGDAEALSVVVPLSTLRLLPYELDPSQVNLHLRGENLLVADITALTPVKPVPDASLGVWTKGRLSQFGTVAAADDLFLDTLNRNRAGRFGPGPFVAVRAGRLRSKGIFSADVTTGLLGLAASIGTSVDDAQAGLFLEIGRAGADLRGADAKNRHEHAGAGIFAVHGFGPRTTSGSAWTIAGYAKGGVLHDRFSVSGAACASHRTDAVPYWGLFAGLRHDAAADPWALRTQAAYFFDGMADSSARVQGNLVGVGREADLRLSAFSAHRLRFGTQLFRDTSFGWSPRFEGAVERVFHAEARGRARDSAGRFDLPENDLDGWRALVTAGGRFRSAEWEFGLDAGASFGVLRGAGVEARILRRFP